jgi:hypothetical protein
MIRYNTIHVTKNTKSWLLILKADADTDTDADADAPAGADADAKTDCWYIYLHNFTQHKNGLVQYVHVAQYENEHTLSLSQPRPVL